MGLSKDRAQVCYKGMLDRGTPASQMIKRGHGETHPKFEPGPAGGNRRTEMNGTDIYGCGH